MKPRRRFGGKSLMALRGKVGLDYLTLPAHIIAACGFYYFFGGFRRKVTFDLVRRRPYAFGVLQAADLARAQGLERVTIVEFGVAGGVGLMNMAYLAREAGKITGVDFRVVGFDTGTGLPPPRDYRDHPDLFQEGDFPIPDFEALRSRLPDNVDLVLGDVAETVPEFLASIAPQAPLAFMSVDVDYYWSAKECLGILSGGPEAYLPAFWAYFDDVTSIDDVAATKYNDWCGERLAIDEFNDDNRLRKIARDSFLGYRRIIKSADWHDMMYLVSILDHPSRTRIDTQREKSIIENRAV